MANRSSSSNDNDGGNPNGNINAASSCEFPSGNAGECDTQFETPPKTRQRLQHYQVASFIHHGNWITDNAHAAHAATSLEPELDVSSPVTSAANLKSKLLMNLTPTSELSMPSWHSGIDGPLTPGTEPAVIRVSAPKTPEKKENHRAKALASAPTSRPLMTSRKRCQMGRTWRKWVSNSRSKQKTRARGEQRCLPRKLVF